MAKSNQEKQNVSTKPSSSAGFSAGLKPARLTGLRAWFFQDNLPSEEMCSWVFDVFHWLSPRLDSHFSPKLVLPSEAFFPVEETASPDEIASGIFQKMLRHAGIQNHNFAIQALAAEGSTVDLMGRDYAFGSGAPRRGAISGLEIDDDIVIRYAPHLVHRPEALISVFAYELARALVSYSYKKGDALPGVDKLEGPFLEVAAIYLGFGVCSANSVFEQVSVQNLQTQGWDTHMLGELSEIEVSYALALFMALHDENLKNAAPFLRTNPKAYVKSSLRYLRREGMDAVRDLQLPTT
ncbi:MAG: hypothetical protein GY822_31055 [Deltaproteobacteria bacterium]|nr:hypothetical protein [Deltaproteobacteria bacterium]